MARREALAGAATDYVLAHGLIGLSLRPLAAALGTSDRMLLYHFGSKDDLVATVLRVSNDRSVAAIAALPTAPDVGACVHALWRASTTGQLQDCQRVYVEAAALGLLGDEPYAGVVGEANRVWVRALVDQLEAAGCPASRSSRAALLLDAAFTGLLLDLLIDERASGLSRQALEQSVSDLADAVVAIAAG